MNRVRVAGSWARCHADQRWPAKHPEYPVGLYDKPSFLSQLTNDSVGGCLIGLDDATWRTPDRALTLAH